MADRNINEAIRKPRRSKGTPFYKTRNIWAACAVAVSGLTWILYELWPQSRKLKKSLQEGKLNDSPAVEHFFLSRQLVRANPALAGAVFEYERRHAERCEGPQAEPWYAKYFKKPQITSTKISKYFPVVENTDKTVESPYKDLLTFADDIKAINIDNDFDDFKSPKPIRIAKVFEISKEKNASQDKKSVKPRTKKSKQRNKGLRTDITKLFPKSEEDNCVDTEHLHMAIALSKSEMQTADHDDPNSFNLTQIVSSQEKVIRLRATLEQFGFNMPSKDKSCLARSIVTETKKGKKSKFKYITPVLCTRTDAKRLELISNKIALLINSKEIVKSEEKIAWQLSARSDLKSYCVEDSRIFQINAAYLSNEQYYVTSLNVPHSDYIPGCLLKKWSGILGRDKSPERQSGNISTKGDHNEKSLDIYALENESAEQQLVVGSKSSLEFNLSYMKSNNEVSDMYDSDSQLQINDVHCSLTENTISPVILGRSDAGCSKDLQMLSPELFLSGDEDLPHHDTYLENFNSSTSLSNKDPVTDTAITEIDKSNNDFVDLDTNIKDINTSLRENDSVINITISQIEKLKPISLDTYFESMQLKKLEKILAPNNLDTENIQESRLSSAYTKEKYNESFEFDNDEELASAKKKAMQIGISDCDDKFIDLTNCIDSDCQILEDQKEVSCPSPKNNLKRFSSFNSTASIDSNASQASDLSIMISDEELNYSTNYSTSNRKRKNKMSTHENIASSYMNVSSYCEDNINNLNNSMNIEEILNKYTDPSKSENITCVDKDATDNCNSILAALDDITSKYIKKTHETEEYIINASLVSCTTINPNLGKDVNVIKPPNKQNVHCSKLMGDFNSATLSHDEDDVQNSPSSVQNVTPDSSKSMNGTPNNDNLIIKTDNITPIPNYMDMNTPKIANALRKFGLKPLKRKRGVQLLQYIYDVTHPEVPDRKSGESEDGSYLKLGVKRKKSDISSFSAVESYTEGIEIVGDIIDERESVKDIIIEQKKSLKLSTCPVPLNIAWHNLLAVNPLIRESMLLYEPLEIERLYAMLKAQGLKYNVQDLITFLDRKCITIRMKHTTGKRKQSV